MKKEKINTKKTAIIVIDIQKDYCSPKGKITKLGYSIDHIPKVVDNIISFIDSSREFNIPVIFTRMQGNPKVMKPNKNLNGKDAICTKGSTGFEFFKIKPLKKDIQLIKTSYDAFSNQKLQKMLQEKKIKNLIILGVYSQVCVGTTIRSAFTKGYNVFVPKDLIASVKERKRQEKSEIEVWEFYFAHVMNSKEIIKLWQQK